VRAFLAVFPLLVLVEHLLFLVPVPMPKIRTPTKEHLRTAMKLPNIDSMFSEGTAKEDCSKHHVTLPM
jgi:hypothetical protein